MMKVSDEDSESQSVTPYISDKWQLCCGSSIDARFDLVMLYSLIVKPRTKPFRLWNWATGCSVPGLDT